MYDTNMNRKSRGNPTAQLYFGMISPGDPYMYY